MKDTEKNPKMMQLIKMCLLFFVFAFGYAEKSIEWPGHDGSIYEDFNLPHGYKFWIHGTPLNEIAYDSATGMTKEFKKFRDYEGVVDIVSDGNEKYFLGPKHNLLRSKPEGFCHHFLREDAPDDVFIIIFKTGGKYRYIFHVGSVFWRVYSGEVKIRKIKDFEEPWKITK